MKIKRVDADWLHVPIPEAQQHVSDFGRVASFDCTLVRIETECGLVGHGEAKAVVGSAGNNHALTELIRVELGALLIARTRATSPASLS
jgi:L-alanine-DL-glutamate epimerase-like enolase superfamily enzyme